MQWLAGHGYHAVTLRSVWDRWHGNRVLPGHAIVISFDDGYRSDVGVALPVLRQHGWPAVLNLKVGNLKPGDLRPRGVRRLIAAGWEIDAHTITHPDLTTVGDAQLGATTTNWGLARPSQPYTLDRVRVSGSDGVDGFAAKLTSLAR